MKIISNSYKTEDESESYKIVVMLQRLALTVRIMKSYDSFSVKWVSHIVLICNLYLYPDKRLLLGQTMEKEL